MASLTIDAPSSADLVGRAAALAPKLAERASACLRLRRVPDETVADFIATGLHRLPQPQRFGGCESGVEAQAAATIELGKGDGSQGWALASYVDAAGQLGSFGSQAQEEVWGEDATALLAAALAGRGRLEVKRGDYLASGTWSCAAGIDQARWLIARGVIEQGDQRRRVSLLVPKSTVTVLDDWNVTGLAGTGAKSFTLDAVPVPAHRVLEEQARREDSGPIERANPEAARRSPREGASLVLAGVPLGIAATMLEEFVALACDTAKRGARVHSNFATSLRIAESKAEIEAATLAVLEAASETTRMRERGEQVGAERRALNELAAAYAALATARAAGRLFGGGGAKVNLLSNRLQRHLLDIHAIGAMEPFVWDTTASTYGRLRLGEKLGEPSGAARS